DKVLQLKLVEDLHHIYYLENAIIFDEKVENAHAFKQQRNRWVSSQFIYLKRFFKKGIQQLFKGNLNYFNLAIANNIIVPRAFLIAFLPILVVIAWFLFPQVFHFT